MSAVIKVENLSKKYIIGHQQQERYIALRDVLANGAKVLFHRAARPFTSKRPRFIDPSREEFYALKDLSFEIHQGDRLGIIGHNGAGKSTLLKILSRITEPTSGRVAIKGRVASLLEVGTGFHPELTGRENIYLNGSILGMSRLEIRKKFDEIVGFAEMEKFLDTPVKRYSSGMYVRLAFAVAAHLEPEILVVDEVLAVGDAQFQKKCLGKMDSVAREGRTVLFVSHNMQAISSLCHRGIVLSRGKIAHCGTAISAINYYMGSFQSAMDGKMLWDATQKNLPYSDVVKLKRYFIEDENGEVPDGRLFSSKSYNVVIEAELLQNDPRLIFSLIYYAEDGRLILGTDIHDTGGVDFRTMRLGNVRFKVPVPTELLANKIYEIELLCIIHMTAWILAPQNESRMRFEFFMDKNDNPNNYDKILSDLRVVLNWDVVAY